VVLASIWLVLFLVKITAPSDLMDNDQERPAAYVMDCVVNGKWICQRDQTGDVASKPPLYTWAAALLTLLAGRASLWALYLPGALAVLGTVLLIFIAGRQILGPPAGFWAGLAYLLSSTTYKQLALARTDPVFTLTVFGSALLAFWAWQRGRAWPWFWLAAAAATLTKGPLGVVFALGGLVAAPWERRTDPQYALPPVARNPGHLAGLGLFILISGGWFLTAWLTEGKAFIDKVMLRELVGHAVPRSDADSPWWRCLEPALYFLSRFLPWSILACASIWRVFRAPAPHARVRSFERFLTGHLILGLLILSVASHKRADLNLPLLPAAALLAGRQIAEGLQRIRPRLLVPATVAVVLAVIVGFGLHSHLVRPGDRQVRLTGHVLRFSRSLPDQGTGSVRIEYLDAPYALQFFGNTLRRNVTADTAARLLTGPEPAYVVVKNLQRFEQSTGLAPGNPLHIVATCLVEDRPYLTILGNRPQFEQARPGPSASPGGEP